MRKIAVLCTMLLASSVLYAQEAKKDAPKSPRVTSTSDIGEVSYGQPSKRGRDIFGALVPYNEVWRTGANMSTDLTFNSDVDFGGQPVKKGTYAVFTIPGETEWTVILNSKPKQKGAAEYDANKDKNVAEVKAQVQKLSEVQEALAIDFEGNNFVIKWDTVKVEVPVTKK